MSEIVILMLTCKKWFSHLWTCVVAPSCQNPAFSSSAVNCSHNAILVFKEKWLDYPEVNSNFVRMNCLFKISVWFFCSPKVKVRFIDLCVHVEMHLIRKLGIIEDLRVTLLSMWQMLVDYASPVLHKIRSVRSWS